MQSAALRRDSFMNSFVKLPEKIAGYGACTPAQVLQYLTRSVNGVCYAAAEEQYAAQVIRELQAEVQELRQELDQQQAATATATSTQPTDIQDLLAEIAELRAEQKRDSMRIAYCLQESLYSQGDFVVGNFEQEPVVNGNYRAALDKIMGF